MYKEKIVAEPPDEWAKPNKFTLFKDSVLVGFSTYATKAKFKREDLSLWHPRRNAHPVNDAEVSTDVKSHGAKAKIKAAVQSRNPEVNCIRCWIDASPEVILEQVELFNRGLASNLALVHLSDNDTLELHDKKYLNSASMVGREDLTPQRSKPIKANKFKHDLTLNASKVELNLTLANKIISKIKRNEHHGQRIRGLLDGPFIYF